MDRISTQSAYGSVLSNLMSAEIRQSAAGNQLSSQKIATDLKGYAANAETLSALQATNTRVGSYLDQTQVIAAKLSTQDSALNQVADATSGARQAIAGAVASGSGDSLMQSLQNYFSNAIQGLNTTYNGEYIFSGGQVSTKATTAATLSDLTTAPSVASLFHNDQLTTSNQLDDATSIKSGFLADQLGTPLFNALQAIQAYSQGPGGPFTSQLNDTQKAFLTSTLAGLDTVHSDLINVAGQNGLMQSQVSNSQTDLTQRQTMLSGLISNLTAADVAKATTDLQQAQLAVQAAGQVYLTLKNSSLINILPPG